MKIYYRLIIAVVLMAISKDVSAQKFRNVNPNSTSEAKQLLSFLYEIKGRYTLTAQHNFIAGGSKYTDSIYKITGKSPVIWGSDFSFAYVGDRPQSFRHCGPLNLTDPFDPVGFTALTPDVARAAMVKTAISEHKKGHIITLMWHACPPTIGGDVCDGDNIWTWQTDRRPTDAQWKELTTDGTPLNKSWKKQLDNVAGYLKQLKDAHVPVLWRPYHENNGIWFWWCNRKGDDGFKKLWIMMYSYFVNVHHLDNLVWVWNTNAPRDRPGDEAGPYADFYPGANYVDVMATDVYHLDWKQSHHDELLKLANGKPIALGEVGNVPTPQILKDQPNWAWFMPWGNLAVKNNTAEAIKAIYNSPTVLSTADISINKNGAYVIHK
jgi:mannan endo-1,4-beta-mannosidase